MMFMLRKMNQSIEDLRKDHLKDNYIRFQFSSKRKRMSTIIENCGETEHGYDRRIHMKGASEQVIKSCQYYLDENEQKKTLDDTVNGKIDEIINDYASNSLRTIAFAYKDLQQGEGGATHEDPDPEGSCLNEVEVGGYTLLAIVGIRDVVREEVPDAVKRCQKAQIRVRMVTGDNRVTATAIAKECDILDKNQKQFGEYEVMEGQEFYEMMGGLICRTCNSDKYPCDCEQKKIVEGVRNLKAFKKVKDQLKVLARSRPEDKYLLVTGLRECGEIVAVTGDGTNDAPALKKADVGFAMGIAGTPVAKDACDIVIMDDNFATIVTACKWGRNIYDNIRRFLQF